MITEKLKPFKVDKTLNEYLASLSISPKEPTQITTPPDGSQGVISALNLDVHLIFEESYQLTVRELSTLIKDKLKLINIK